MVQKRRGDERPRLAVDELLRLDPRHHLPYQAVALLQKKQLRPVLVPQLELPYVRAP